MTVILPGAQRHSIDQLRTLAQQQIDGKVKARAFFPGAEIRDAELNQKNEDGSDKDIVAVINTDTIDRYQSIVDPRGGEFENYIRNPILLWQHGLDYAGAWPVGNVRTITPTDSNVEVTLAFDTEGALGAELNRLYRQKKLRGFSIGFIPKSYQIEQKDGMDIIRYTSWELCELSAVSVPANPEALARSFSEITDLRLRTALADALPKQSDAKLDDQRTKDAKGRTIVVDPMKQRQAPPATQQRHPAESQLEEVEITTPAGKIRVSLPPEQAAQVRASSLGTQAASQVELFDRAWDCQAEAQGMTTEDAQRMAAVCVEDGDNVTVLCIHHHRDGQLNFKALAASMARVLTQPMDCTDEQRDACYEHLAAHYRELKIEPPEAGAMDEDRAYELALEGRLAHLDDDGDAWLFAEPVEEEGCVLAGFVAIDDERNLKLCVGPEIGPHADSKNWGTRKALQVDQTARMLQKLAQQNREILELKAGGGQSRVGAVFNTRNKKRILAAAEQCEGLANEFKTKSRDLLATASDLRSMIDEAEGIEEGVSASRGTVGGSAQPGGSGGSEADEQTKRFVRSIVAQSLEQVTGRKIAV